MSIVAQQQLFSWQDVKNIGDLERLLLVLKYLPDEELITTLFKLQLGLNYVEHFT
jgi:hypothetical protein